MEIRRGDIFYVMRSGVEVGSEQWSGRPGVVVSCDENNIHSEVIEVAYCTEVATADARRHHEHEQAEHSPL